MIWTLIAFFASMLILQKYAFPRISEALEKRARLIQDSIDHAEQTRREADEMLEEYRARLKEAREQAEDILVRSRKAAEQFEAESKEKVQKEHQDAMERTRRERWGRGAGWPWGASTETVAWPPWPWKGPGGEKKGRRYRARHATRKALAARTISAGEKAVRKTLEGEDQKRLIEEGLFEV